MIQWNEQRVINAPIDKVWSLFSDEQLQTIMPQLGCSASRCVFP